jgi:hypothetical protein
VEADRSPARRRSIATWPGYDRPPPLRVRAHCGSLVSPPETTGARATLSLARSPARGSTLLRCPPPSGSCSVRRVALYWLPALPPRRSRRPRGFPRRALSRNVSPTPCPLGVRCLYRVPGFASARAPLLRRAPPKGDASFRCLRACLSWGSCSHARLYVGCPFSAANSLAGFRVGRGSPGPRRCRPQGSCPSRRFRLARGAYRGR